jgi:hypothetical protein
MEEKEEDTPRLGKFFISPDLYSSESFGPAYWSNPMQSAPPYRESPESIFPSDDFPESYYRALIWSNYNDIEQSNVSTTKKYIGRNQKRNMKRRKKRAARKRRRKRKKKRERK